MGGNSNYSTSGNSGNNSQNNSSGSSANLPNKFEFPFCLSVIIVKIADLILNPKDVKKDYKNDIDNVRLIYKYDN